jgi:hypothetical protein
VASSITGSSLTRAGGGGGHGNYGGAAGGSGGGGNGGSGTGQNGTDGTENLGGGGGGGTAGGLGGNGGSGVVILKYPSAYVITIGAGLTGSTSVVGADKITTITAGTGNVSFT